MTQSSIVPNMTFILYKVLSKPCVNFWTLSKIVKYSLYAVWRLKSATFWSDSSAREWILSGILISDSVHVCFYVSYSGLRSCVGHSEVFQALESFHEGWLNTIWGLFPVFSRMWTTLTRSPCLGPAWPRTKLSSSIANPHRVGRPVAKYWNASGEYGAIRAHMLPTAISETETVCRGSLCVCVCVDPQVQPAICVSLFATSLVPAAAPSRRCCSH